jgi:hypothetical protein
MLIDDLSSGSMPDLYTAVRGECGAVDLQQHTQCDRLEACKLRKMPRAMVKLNLILERALLE